MRRNIADKLKPETFLLYQCLRTSFSIGLTESDTGKRRFGHKVGLMEIPLVSPSSLPRQKIFILLLPSMLIIVYNL